jgi:hypothetical protein
MQWCNLLRVNYVIKDSSAPQCYLDIIKATKASWATSTSLRNNNILKVLTFWVDLPIPQMDFRVSKLSDLFKVDIFGPHMAPMRSFNKIRLRV